MVGVSNPSNAINISHNIQAHTAVKQNIDLQII